MENYRHLDDSAYRRGTVRAKRVAIKVRLRYTARSLDPAERLVFEARLGDLEKDCPAPKVQQAPVALSKILSQDDFKRCQAVAAPRQQGLFTFGYATGCRVSEAIGIRLIKPEFAKTGRGSMFELVLQMVSRPAQTWGRRRSTTFFLMRMQLFYFVPNCDHLTI